MLHEIVNYFKNFKITVVNSFQSLNNVVIKKKGIKKLS